MSRSILNSIGSLESWVTRSASRCANLARGGDAGTRGAPTQTTSNDQQIGSRLDNGEKLTKDGKPFQRYKLQPNKQADNRTLRDLANKNSHQVLAQADMSLDESIPAATRVANFFAALRDDAKAKWGGKGKK